MLTERLPLVIGSAMSALASGVLTESFSDRLPNSDAVLYYDRSLPVPGWCSTPVVTRLTLQTVPASRGKPHAYPDLIQ